MKKIWPILIIAIILLLSACTDTLPERIGDSYYIEYTFNGDKFAAAPQITYLEMFGLDKTTVLNEKERVEKRGETFKMRCEIYFQSGCFDNVAYTVDDIESQVRAIATGQSNMLKSALYEMPLMKEDQDEAMAFESATAFLRYGNELAEASLLFYCDNVILEDFTGIIDGSSHIVGFVPIIK